MTVHPNSVPAGAVAGVYDDTFVMLPPWRRAHLVYLDRPETLCGRPVYGDAPSRAGRRVCARCTQVARRIDRQVTARS